MEIIQTYRPLRIVLSWLVVAVLAGCAHSGAIPHSPCACDFHTLPTAQAVPSAQA